MSDSPKDHDFDWVKARYECSTKFEFECLRRDIQRCADTRKEHLAGESTKLFVHSKSDMVLIEREDGKREPRPGVRLCLMYDYILVQPPAPAKEFKLTLTLNDEGKCRFAINGEGEYKRWQVLRRALESLLFSPSLG